MPNRAMPLQSWLSVDISCKISCTQSNHLADQLDLLITSIDSSHPSLVFVCVFLYRKDSVCVFLCVPRLAWGQGHSGSWVDPRLGVTASSAGTLVGTEARHQPRCGRRLSKIEQLDSVCRRTHGGFSSKGLENLLYLFNIQMTRSTPRRSALTTIQSDHIQTKKMKCLKAIAISWSFPGINNVSEILPDSTQ